MFRPRTFFVNPRRLRAYSSKASMSGRILIFPVRVLLSWAAAADFAAAMVPGSRHFQAVAIRLLSMSELLAGISFARSDFGTAIDKAASAILGIIHPSHQEELDRQ